MDELIEYASAEYTLPGQTESGDRHIIMPVLNGVLMAVIDGLGHGREAAIAAKRAVASIERYAKNNPLTDLAHHCHAALSGTRGAVMNMAILDGSQNTVTWLGIGNVEGRLLLKTTQSGYAQQTLLLRAGVVGHHLPQLLTSTTRVRHGDLLIFATDGIQQDFADNLTVEDSPVEKIAQHIISRYCKKTDDALVLVIRYLG